MLWWPARDENKGLQWPPRNENKPQEPVSVQAESVANEDLLNLQQSFVSSWPSWVTVIRTASQPKVLCWVLSTMKAFMAQGWCQLPPHPCPIWLPFPRSTLVILTSFSYSLNWHLLKFYAFFFFFSLNVNYVSVPTLANLAIIWKNCAPSKWRAQWGSFQGFALNNKKSFLELFWLLKY